MLTLRPEYHGHECRGRRIRAAEVEKDLLSDQTAAESTQSQGVLEEPARPGDACHWKRSTAVP